MPEPAITVAGLLDSRPETIGLPIELLSGRSGLDRVISSPHIQKTGLALSGLDEYLRPARILIFGESEVKYLERLTPEARLDTLAAVLTRDIPCVLITSGWHPPAELLFAAEHYNVPLLRTSVATPLAIAKVTTLLDDRLAVREVIHGVLMDILGLGVLIVGESGIGKSECALDLVVRGHRLVADDTVEVRRRGEAVVIGTCPELTRHHMEVRGLGIINIRDLFGVASTRTSKRVELVVQLERWDPPARSHGEMAAVTAGARGVQESNAGREYDRLGLDEAAYDLRGLKVPLIRMPVAPGRSLAILVEVAARNQLLRSRGSHAARELVSRLEARLRDQDADADADEDVEHGGRL